MPEKTEKTEYQKEESRIGILTVIAAFIGFVAGVIAFALYHLIGSLTELFFYGKFVLNFGTQLPSPVGNPLGLFVIAIPVIGGIIAGVMIKYGSTQIIGHGIPEAMESILLRRSKIPPKVGILKAISAAFTIGSGQPFGAEGPIIQTGGAFGSYIGQIIKMSGEERKILLACGAAAGMAATFGTPISAVLLVIELLLFEFRVKSLVPVAIASAIGAGMHIVLISSQPLFFIQTPFDFGKNGGLYILPYFVVLGLICGVAGTFLSRSLYKSEDLFRKLPIGHPWLPAIGGLAAGIIGYFVPYTLGVGYNVITDVITGQFVVTLVIAIALAKALSWILAMGSQTSGGTLAPLFLVGASLGSAYGTGLAHVVPGWSLSAGIFSIAAMGAVFGTASRAPFASILFVLEVTQQFQGVLPIIVTAVVAELVGEYLMEDSIMTEKLARRGMRVRNIYEYNPLRQITVKRLMSSPLVTVDAKTSAVDVYKQANEPKSQYWNKKRFVVLKDGKILGIATREQLYEEAAKADPDLTIEKISSKDGYYTIREDELGYQALQMMALYNAKFLIVLDKQDKPVGYVSLGDLTQALRHKVIDETVMG